MIRTEPAATKKEVSPYLIWFFVWVGITVVGLILTPHQDGHGTHRQLGFPPCPSVLIFNRPCPGCGLTTSWTATLHGKLEIAMGAHALGPALYLGFTLSAFASLWLWHKQRYFVYSRAFYRFAWFLIGIFLAYTIYRFVFPPPSYNTSPFAPPTSSKRAP